MNCPYCGNETTKGWIRSARRVRFTVINNESGFDFKAKGDVVLTSNNFINPACIAYHCATCKKVVIDYAEKEQ